MRKISLFCVICLLALFLVSLAGCKKEENGTNNGGGEAQAEFVDLGLPSGTKWKASNETGGYQNVFYTYNEAVSTFGYMLPTKEQYEELMDNCVWEWKNNGCYKVTGQNGNYIVLPTAGYRNCDDSVYCVGSVGCYWSSTPNGSEGAYGIDFGSGYVCMGSYSRCSGSAVRLVQY